MLILIGSALGNQIICTDTRCSVQFPINVTGIQNPSLIPNNPCVNLNAAAGSYGINFASRFVCNSTYTLSNNNMNAAMNFNIIFGGDGNYSYYLVPDMTNTQNIILTLDVSLYSNMAQSPSATLIAPPKPVLFRYCQDLGKTNVSGYSALFNLSGNCKPVNAVFTTTQQDFTFTANSCFSQMISETGPLFGAVSKVSQPITQISLLTQHCSVTAAQSIIQGTFERIYNATVNVIPISVPSGITTPASYPVQQINVDSLVFQNLSLGEYNLTFDFDDACLMRYYQRLPTQLLVLNYVVLNVQMNIICNNVSDVCSSTFSLPGMQQFATSGDVCAALQIIDVNGTRIKLSQFQCSFNVATQQTTVNFVNTSFTNMSFSVVTGTPVIEDTTNIIRLNRTARAFLDVFDVTIANVTANYIFDTSKIYCNLQSYSDINTNPQNFVTVNKYGCSNELSVQIPTPAPNDSLVSVNYTFIFDPCFGPQVISAPIEVFLFPFYLQYTLPTTPLNYFDVFSVTATFFDQQATGMPIYQPPTTQVFLQDDTTNQTVIPLASVQINQSTYRFDFNVPVTGNWYFNIQQALDRCTLQLTYNAKKLLGTINVVLTYFVDETPSQQCIVPGNQNTNYMDYTGINMMYNYTYTFKLSGTSYGNLLDVLAATFQTTASLCSDKFAVGNSQLSNIMCKFDNTTKEFTLDVNWFFAFGSRNAATTAANLCFLNSLNDGATPPQNLSASVCLRLKDPVLECANFYNESLDICTARQSPPENIFSSGTNITTDLSNGSKNLSITLVDRFGAVINNSFIFTHHITITYINIVPLYNCTITCDLNTWLNISLNYSQDLTIQRVYLKGTLGATAELQRQNATFWAQKYYNLDISGTLELLVDYSDICGTTYTLNTNYTTTIIKSATYSFSDQLVYLNSFTYYEIKPQGFQFAFANAGTQQNISIVNSTTTYQTLPAMSNQSVLAIQLRPGQNNQECNIFATIVPPEVNGTIWARPSAGCNFTDGTLDQNKIGQHLLVPMDVLAASGSPLGQQVTLTIVIVDTPSPNSINCTLVQALLAQTKPYRYYQGYNYAAKCKGFFVTLTTVNGQPAPSIYLDTVPASVSVTTCTASIAGIVLSGNQVGPKACYRVDVSLTNDSQFFYDPANEVKTYQEYVVLPLFLKHSLARKANQLNSTYKQTILNYMFDEYKNCVAQGATSCHQGYRFPYSLAAANLAAEVSPAVQQLLLNDFFSADQLNFVASPGGLLGVDYMYDLAGLSKLHGNVSATILRQQVDKFLELITLPEGIQLGFSGQYFELQAADAVFGLTISDFLSCRQQQTLNLQGIQYNVSTTFNASGLRGCTNKQGSTVLIERNISTNKDTFKVVSGGDQVNITVNTTSYSCPAGTTVGSLGLMTQCIGNFTGSFQSNINNSGLANWQIALIVIAVLLLLGGIAGLTVFLVKKYPPNQGPRVKNTLQPRITGKSLQRYRLK